MIHLYKYDIPEKLLKIQGQIIAIDTETTGLNYNRDRLCVVQLCLEANKGEAHLVHFPDACYDKSTNLQQLIAQNTGLYHYARFDVAMIEKFLHVQSNAIICTKIASKLCRTYSDKHGLKHLVKEYLGIEVDKSQQSSYWANDSLSIAQQQYAANDVIYLHQIWQQITLQLDKENRLELAKAFFAFLPTVVKADLAGFQADLFHH